MSTDGKTIEIIIASCPLCGRKYVDVTMVEIQEQHDRHLVSCRVMGLVKEFVEIKPDITMGEIAYLLSSKKPPVKIEEELE